MGTGSFPVQVSQAAFEFLAAKFVVKVAKIPAYFDLFLTMNGC